METKLKQILFETKNHLGLTINDAIEMVAKHRLRFFNTFLRAEYTFHKNGIVDVTEFYINN